MNNRRTSTWLLTACAAMSLSGCFGGKPPVRPESQLKAEALIKRAIRAEQKNDSQQAEQYLIEALQLSSSIEDLPVKAQTLVNLARLSRLHGTVSQADDRIKQALTILNPESDSYAEAVHEKALIELAAGNRETARQWAVQSVKAEKGQDTGCRQNLLGRVLIALEDPAGAETVLNRALAENRKYNHQEEEANSLRMLGIVARLRKGTAESERLLNEALTIDKKIAVSSKIAADLEELAATALAANKSDQAVQFLDRASAVNLAGGRRSQAAANQAALGHVFDLLGDGSRANKARSRSRELSGQPTIQAPDTVPETTNPSSSP